MAEAGVPGFAILPWVAMFAPGKTPPRIVERLSREVAAAMKRPDVREGLDRAGFDYESSTPQELGAFLQRTAQGVGHCRAGSRATLKP